MSTSIMNRQPRADALVLFGATGDLAKRKLFPALYDLERHGKLDIPVIGVARSDWTDETFCKNAREAILLAKPDADEETIRPLMQLLDLICGDYSDQATWETLRATLDKHNSQHAVFYMAIPPSIFPEVAQRLASVGLNERGRIVVEKPFGRDLKSAQELNATLLVFRFSNTLLEPVWNRGYVRSVQVTMSETIGVEGRGAFYDEVGAFRDVLQNHLLQVVALLAMEPPAGPDSRFLQDEKAKVLAAMEPIDPKNVVRGQYVGYRDEPGVAPDSKTETFAAAKLEIDSWRWAGVPWYVRVGKALAADATEAVVEFHSPPRLLFDEAGGPTPGRNLVRFRLGKRDGVTFTVQAKTPGEHLDSQAVDLGVDFAAALGERLDAYVRLIGDAIAGSPRRFARVDVVEQAWAVVQPVLDAPGDVNPYFRGSWGPSEATRLLADGENWYEPSL
jgi:glucose-6-phosphate 1-dehydrogenase